MNLSPLAVKAHAAAHGEKCLLVSQFTHPLYLGKALRRKMHPIVPSLSSLTMQVQSWACYVDVHFGDRCSSNVSSKVNERSGQLFTCPENIWFSGFHNGWLEPCEPNLLRLLYGS